MMEEAKKALEALFDEMLGNIKYFKKKSYADLFEQLYQEHKDELQKLALSCKDENNDTDIQAVGELASVIPTYAGEKIKDLSKRKKEITEVDYNMTMAVYIVPLITYSKDPACDQLAEQMVKLWNEKKVTSLKLSKSSFEDISGGFRTGFCYITTAVCGQRKLPDDCYELLLLRRYRDQYLMQTEAGRRMVEEYYHLAPGIVLAINQKDDAGEIYEGIYHTYIRPCIEMVERGEDRECCELYTDMVYQLRDQYLYS